MKQALKNNAALALLCLLLILACAPLGNLLNPTDTPTIANSPTATSVAASEQTPTVAVGRIPTSTVTPVPRSTVLPTLTELYAFIQAPEGLLAQPYSQGHT